ncbi:VQ protein [Dillenia turbinata]|uniref:VQ protein n=1 Tax=Dillenia turbinata TaxID=194707 RepID=A0AAN8UGJ1_9MAGN
MGKLQNHPTHQNSKKINKQPIKGNRKPMKVTYISSPMMVKACNPSEFRALVQELTGKDSDICCQEKIGATATTEEEGKEFDYFDVSKCAEVENVKFTVEELRRIMDFKHNIRNMPDVSKIVKIVREGFDMLKMSEDEKH